MGKSFNISNSVLTQLPFFSCKNILINSDYQKDIARYIYCSELKSPPYPGPYGEQPSKWVQKVFIIKNSLKTRENNLKRKHSKET